MKARDFELQPFPAPGAYPGLMITGTIGRGPRSLAIRYAVHGHQGKLVVPGPAERPARRQGLWEETCFEFFLAVKQAPHYWEFNLSPSGHWNVYRFDDYREGMVEEPAIAVLPCRFEGQSGCLNLAGDCPLDGIIPGEQPLEVAVSAVLRHRDGRISYWALTHPGSRPDFHRRDGFILEL